MAGQPVVALDGDTAVVAGGDANGTHFHVYGRNEDRTGRVGGAGEPREPREPGDPDFVCCGAVRSASVSGDYIILGAPFHIQIRARNQGGPNAWGLVRLFRPPGSAPLHYSSVAIDGDTAFLDADPAPDNDTVSVLVSDVDRDGIRDARDSCPRDPLNNVPGDCQRNSATSGPGERHHSR